MDEENKRISSAMEKARLKAEYKRIMNECNDVLVKRKKEGKASASSSENNSKGREGLLTSTSPSNESRKRLPTSASSNESKKKQKEKEQEELDWIENEKVVVARKKADAKSEKN